AHVTTALETQLFDAADSPAGKQITAEVSPHHLLWTVDDYPRLGSRIKMNPAVKTAADREALRRALAEGRLDIVATDHAPHLLEEKEGDVFHAVSGAPMVQFSLPAMLDLYDPTTVVRRMACAPAELFGIERRGFLRPGYFADMALVERLEQPYTVSDRGVLSRCGWTPMAGSQLHHRVVRSWVNGGTGPAPLQFSRR
ncbi:MAG: amidohydrolase family protein, partial [Muribaculaceae bacterium]|nr:amidohydrolase family protein [Muribaculaceae bacterium]